MKIDTISKMFLNTVDTYPDKPLFNYKENNNWIPLTGKDIKLTVSSISFALSYKNIFPKEKVAILSTTSYRWALCDYGIISLRAVTVTVYPTLLPDHIKHIINDSGSKLIFAAFEKRLWGQPGNGGKGRGWWRLNNN